MIGQALQATQRRPFEGVAKILRYNWPQYVVGVLVVVAAVVAATLIRAPAWVAPVLLGGALLSAWWLVASIVASHWVYDRSSLYRWTWASAIPKGASLRWVNVHAGLDESTPGLTIELQEPPVIVLDIFDPAEMTEPSIARARKDAQALWPCVPYSGSVPSDVQDVAVIFAIFCLHEVRRDQRRVDLMAQLASRLSRHGRFFVVEHLRDAANFVVFGAGFVHFLSRSVWMRTFAGAGLQVVSERRVTPFVRVFELQRSA